MKSGLKDRTEIRYPVGLSKRPSGHPTVVEKDATNPATLQAPQSGVQRTTAEGGGTGHPIVQRMAGALIQTEVCMKGKRKRPRREEVISHLQIIHTWASFAMEHGTVGVMQLDHIAQWTLDAVEMMREDERMEDDVK